MIEWECSGSSWTTGLIPTLETDFKAVKDVCIDKFTGRTENKYRLQNAALENTDTTPTEKIIILTFQAYCRYIALQKRLLSGMTIAKSEVTSLGGIIAPSKSTRIVFCRECFSCPDLDQFHLSGENKAPVLKGRPRKKKLRSSTLAKELKRKRFLADLERVKKNLPAKKMKLSESEEGTESDLSEESNKSYESMDEDKPHYTIETPVNKIQQPNGLLTVSIKQVAKVMAINEKDLKTVAPPPLIPTVKIKLPSSPPPLQKVKIKTDSPISPKVNIGPPPLYPATQKSDSLKKTNQSFPRLMPRVDAPANPQTHGNAISLPSSKAFTLIKSSSVGVASSSMPTVVTASRAEVATYNSVKAVEPLGNAGKQVLIDGKTIRLQSSDDMKIEGKENKQEGNKTDAIIKPKKKRLRQPCNVKELNEDLADEDEKYFMRSLREFMKSRQTPISKIPALGFKRVNLWTMYSTAQKLGGYDTVTSKRLWRQVYDALGGSTTITSAATYTRRHYERLLLPYENYVRSQLNNKKGLPEQNQSANTSSSQENTAKGHSINNNQADTSTNNNNTEVMKDNKMSINRNQSSGSIPRDSSHQSVTTSKDNTVANHKTSHNSLPGKMNPELGATTGSPVNNTSHKRLTDNVKTSRDNLSSAMVKVKPNGAIPPYSVSVQSVKKDGVTSSKSVIVTKSINVPPSPVVRNSATALPRSSSASTSSTKSDVTPNLPQRGISVTANVTSHQPTVSPASSHSPRPVNHVTPVKSSTTESYSSSVKQSAAVKVVHTEKPQKHAVGIVTSPKIYPPQKLTNQDKNSKDIADGIKYVSRNGPPVSREEVTPQKAYKPERHSSDLPSLNIQNGLSRERELKHIKEPPHQNHINYHQGNARIIHDPKKYDVISSSTHETIAKSTNKRSVHIDPVVNEPINRKLSETDVSQAVACHTQSVTNEPVAKRRKTPSPTVIKVTPQPRDVAQVVTTESRNTCHLAYSQTDTFFSSRHGIQSHDSCKLYNDHVRFKESTSINEIQGSPSVKRINSQREIVDMTESSVAVTSANYSIVYQTSSKSPSYAKITHPKQMYLVGDSCQRTKEPRNQGNSNISVVKHGMNSGISRGYPEENQSKDSYAPHGHYTEIYPTCQPNYRLVEGMTPTGDRKPSKGDIDQAQLNTDQRTASHRTFAESPDEHFQEWRRRQGMSQYPAYITTHQNEQQTRRPSTTEQPVSLGLRTPPLESRYLYVQDEAGIHPRVIEEVPLLLSSKPGMYYQEDTFYGGVPFYHGGWTTTGVADGMTFKGDTDSMNSNSQLRSSSCIFMPTSQIFGSRVSIAPLSPPVLNQGHVVSGQDSVNIHPRLLMTSPYPHNHQMVPQKPTRPLHSYT